MNWNPLSSLFSDSDRDRGQVGIGTLIVFIAMVLVAAIAAGVLINTAGFLQQSAEQTGQESTNAVTQKLEATSVTGEITEGTLESVNMVVKISAGADAIDLGQTTIQFVSAEQDVLLDVEDFTVKNTDGTETSSHLLSAQNERRIITLDLSSTGSIGHELEPGEEATLKITTASGATTHIEVQVPQPATDGYTEL